ncbi:MAG: hypothetical protein R3229_03595 [Alphaproteobacteria bacterium]|nr:hypothetical protein [Alphaproteobacteria bacterium]
MSTQDHLPYEEEARLFTDIIEFFTERLPHAIGETAEHLDEAALSMELFQTLSTKDDAELKEIGITRDELSKVAAAASGLFVVANNRRRQER